MKYFPLHLCDNKSHIFQEIKFLNPHEIFNYKAYLGWILTRKLKIETGQKREYTNKLYVRKMGID
jgi:hypothetical protein